MFAHSALPFESKLLPAVSFFLRIYFPQITVTVTVLKFGWIHSITITVAVLASAVTPSFPLIPNYHLEGHLIRGRHGGVEKRGGRKTSLMTPLPKRGFGCPPVRYVFHPPQVSMLCSSCRNIHDRAAQKLFWRGPKIFGRARSLVRFPPPICSAPLHISGFRKTLRIFSGYF